MYDPDNVAYLACFLDAAISASLLLLVLLWCSFRSFKTWRQHNLQKYLLIMLEAEYTQTNIWDADCLMRRLILSVVEVKSWKKI